MGFRKKNRWFADSAASRNARRTCPIEADSLRVGITRLARTAPPPCFRSHGTHYKPLDRGKDCSPWESWEAAATARRWGSFPTTADVGIWARADSTAELFEALGLGLFALMTDLRTVRPLEERAVQASAPDPGGLVVAFLTQLITLQSVEGFLARTIRCRPVGTPPTALLAQLTGEPFDPARHPRHFEVKAVTFHELEVDLDQHRARVIVDI